MPSQHYLDDITALFRNYKKLADKAMARINDESFFAALDDDISNSIAITVKHIAGNMRSRWTDFLTTDGEKPDRFRDSEFEKYDSDNRQSLMKRWEHGWKILFETISHLSPDDLMKSITIRGEHHTVIEALNRQLTHYAYHVGQIVYLARYYSGPDWKSLSVPKGKSKEFEAKKRTESERMTNEQ